jgi:hypothetical protein
LTGFDNYLLSKHVTVLNMAECVPHGIPKCLVSGMEIPWVSSELGTAAFSLSVPHLWNNLKSSLQQDVLLPLTQFNMLIGNLFDEEWDEAVQGRKQKGRPSLR